MKVLNHSIVLALFAALTMACGASTQNTSSAFQNEIVPIAQAQALPSSENEAAAPTLEETTAEETSLETAKIQALPGLGVVVNEGILTRHEICPNGLAVSASCNQAEAQIELPGMNVQFDTMHGPQF